MRKELEEGDILLCKVEKIEGTTVFVKLLESNKEGVITTSEIAPGRIRNIRDYVVPNKIIACKILRVEGNNVHLSLRRVTGKERQEAMDNFKKEKAAIAALKTILKDKASQVIEKIKEEGRICEFLEKSRDNPLILNKYVAKEEAEKIHKIVCEKKEREVEVKKEFELSSNHSDGLARLKKILENTGEISYITAGKFTIKVKSTDYKKANTIINQFLEEIEKRAKKENCLFKLKEK